MNQITTLFNLLDNWRHLPNYQLERRADIFFAMYLPHVLKHKLGFTVSHIIPEFPLRIGSMTDVNINRSFKVDYAVFVEGRPDYCMFIELKTDDGSRREKQDRYLECATNAGMKMVVDGIVKIWGATSSKNKYRALLKSMEKVNLLNFDNGAVENITSERYQIEVLYLQPNCNEDENGISFLEMADSIRKLDDPFSLRFAESLEMWARLKAGDCE
jgi:hypothetical protein